MKNEKLVEATMLALQGKLEARNPENDEINNKISKTLNGSTKYMDDLDNAGIGVKVNDKGKADSIYSKADDENNKKAKQPNEYVSVRTMNKQDLKNSNTDTDYYKYMTKQKVKPEVTDTGAFEHMNAFRNSDNFEKTVGEKDFKNMYFNTDKNGVSKAIPKKYKTGRKNYDYNPDKFPRKDYHGVASYEPLDNQELQDFKYNKSRVSDDGWLKRDLDKAKAEYDSAKAEYDKVNDQVQGVRDRIAKSKANRKSEARSHKEDKENKTETKNDIMSFEDWVDYIDIKKEYPEWFKDKQELDRPFLDVINDHMDELNRDYRKYKRSQSKKKTESNKLPNTKNLVDLEHKLSDLITNTDDTEVLDILQPMERLLSKYLLDKHISF